MSPIDRRRFVIDVGGAVLLIGAGLVVYYKKKRDAFEAPQVVAP
jgi:hypothetical protein